jgi:hypothetical protein
MVLDLPPVPLLVAPAVPLLSLDRAPAAPVVPPLAAEPAPLDPALELRAVVVLV